MDKINQIRKLEFWVSNHGFYQMSVGSEVGVISGQLAQVVELILNPAVPEQQRQQAFQQIEEFKVGEVLKIFQRLFGGFETNIARFKS